MPGIMIGGINHEVNNPDLYVMGRLFIELNATGNVPKDTLEKLITALDVKDTKAIIKAVRLLGISFHPDKYSGATIAPDLIPYANAFLTVYNEDAVVKKLVDDKQASSKLLNSTVSFSNIVFAAFQGLFLPIDPDTIVNPDPKKQEIKRKQAVDKYATDMAQIKPILRKVCAAAMPKAEPMPKAAPTPKAEPMPKAAPTPKAEPMPKAATPEKAPSPPVTPAFDAAARERKRKEAEEREAERIRKLSEKDAPPPTGAATGGAKDTTPKPTAGEASEAPVKLSEEEKRAARAERARKAMAGKSKLKG